MEPIQPASYDGRKPYIFVSYSHKDADRVYPILTALQQEGYRIWYDGGIGASENWPDTIADHLRDSAAFIVFVSKNSMASENCLDEIAYAKNNQKPSLMILLEADVVIPSGTDMQSSRFQRLERYRYPTMEQFVDKVRGDRLFWDCCGAAGVIPPAAAKSPARKRLPTLIIAIAAAVLVIAAVVGVLLLGGKPDRADADVGLEKLIVLDSYGYSYHKGEGKDAFGDTHGGYHLFEPYEGRTYEVSFELAEGFTTFFCDVVAAGSMNPDGAVDVLFYVDGKLVERVDDYTKETAPVTIELNVTEGEELTIKVKDIDNAPAGSRCNIMLVEAALIENE